MCGVQPFRVSDASFQKGAETMIIGGFPVVRLCAATILGVSKNILSKGKEAKGRHFMYCQYISRAFASAYS